MQLEELARSILFGSRWEDKLLFGDALEDDPTQLALTEAPHFPGRPHFLLRSGKAEFPKQAQMKEDTTRGRVLHFFANHELLAMELMALMLLKFPTAPKAFRAGIARTIREEQDHLRLYVDRMRELGVDFGELPVSEYFWNVMKDMRSPLEFVVQMSLTLEQANLDFSLQYQRAVAAVGDEKTAKILERVYLEEIGHVKHGLTWFNRWREIDGNEEDDWDAYRRLLPPPMSPRRAKGEIFDVEARRKAGFSERFIRELEVHSGSKGRPPVFWFFNPSCDAEIVRGKPGFTPSRVVQNLTNDLETLPMFLSRESDVVLVQDLPQAEWIKSIRDLGVATPEFRRKGEVIRESMIGGFEPWGWSPVPFDRFRPYRDRLSTPSGANGRWCRGFLGQESFAKAGLGQFFSKAWSVEYFRSWLGSHPEHEDIFGRPSDVGQVYRDWESAKERIERSCAEGQDLIAKAPWGTSGNQNKRINGLLTAPLTGWIRNTIQAQGCIVLEPWLEKIVDLSVQLEVAQDTVRLLGVRRFINGPHLEYRGTLLDPKLRSLSEEVQRFLHAQKGPLEIWTQFAQALGADIRSAGYEGPAGIDAMIWRDSVSQSLRFKPLVELNPRWTMGRVAIEIEKHVISGVPAAWVYIPVRELKAVQALQTRYPIRIERDRMSQGVVFTTDPARALEVLTVLVVGASATQDLALLLGDSAVLVTENN